MPCKLVKVCRCFSGAFCFHLPSTTIYFRPFLTRTSQLRQFLLSDVFLSDFPTKVLHTFLIPLCLSHSLHIITPTARVKNWHSLIALNRRQTTILNSINFKLYTWGLKVKLNSTNKYSSVNWTNMYLLHVPIKFFPFSPRLSTILYIQKFPGNRYFLCFSRQQRFENPNVINSCNVNASASADS
jgi:hypothetical protein